jgi:hypothetical protein
MSAKGDESGALHDVSGKPDKFVITIAIAVLIASFAALAWEIWIIHYGPQPP